MKHLIGKRILRTKPVTYPTGTIDRSYTTGTGELLVGVSDTHIYLENPWNKQPQALDSLWMDGNWVEYNPSVDYTNRAIGAIPIIFSIGGGKTLDEPGKQCDHDWMTWMGLHGTITDCGKCGAKK